MHLQRIFAAWLAIVASLLFVGAAHSATPMAKTQAPGFYRMMLGDFEVTALSDGTVALPVGTLLTRTTPDHVKRARARISRSPWTPR